MRFFEINNLSIPRGSRNDKVTAFSSTAKGSIDRDFEAHYIKIPNSVKIVKHILNDHEKPKTNNFVYIYYVGLLHKRSLEAKLACQCGSQVEILIYTAYGKKINVFYICCTLSILNKLRNLKMLTGGTASARLLFVLAFDQRGCLENVWQLKVTSTFHLIF